MISNKNKKFHPYITMAIVCAVMYVIIQLVLTPVYTSVVLRDYVLRTSPLATVFEVAFSFGEILTFALCYSVVIYCAVFDGLKKALGACGIYLIASVVRRAGALAVSLIMYHSLDFTDIINVTIPVLIEAAQILVVLFCSYSYGKKRADRHSADSYSNTDIQFEKVYSKSNPLMKSALAGGIMLSGINVAMRIYRDINYGAPADIAEALIMAVYYLSDVLVLVVFYALSWFTLSKMVSKYRVNN